MQVIRSGNNGSKGIQQTWHSALVWAYSYPKTRPVIKVAWDRIQIIFYHTQEIQTGDNWKCCNLKSSLSKILNARSIPEQARKSEFFQEYFQYQKKSKTIHRIQRIPEPLGLLKLYVLKYMHPSSYFSSPNKGSFQLFWRFQLFQTMLTKSIQLTLNWKYHVNDLFIKLNRANAFLFKMRKYVSLKRLRSIYFAIFDSYLSYCCLVWAQYCNTIQQIVILQKKAVTIINLQLRNSRTSSLFKQGSILKYHNKICLENILFFSESLNKL